jgi:hypothetical protein
MSNFHNIQSEVVAPFTKNNNKFFLGRICWSMVGGIMEKKEDVYTSMCIYLTLNPKYNSPKTTFEQQKALTILLTHIIMSLTQVLVQYNFVSQQQH